jgi:hypothetical protein
LFRQTIQHNPVEKLFPSYGASTMRAIRVFAMVLALVLAPALVHAGGLVLKLPKDGTWAIYRIEMTRDDNGKTQRDNGTLRIASVGLVTVAGQRCRWMEFAFTTEPDIAKSSDSTKDNKRVQWPKEITKVLIPEKFLAGKETPLDHAVRAWIGRIPGTASTLAHPEDVEEGPLPVILAGPFKDVKSLGKATVESKLGKLSCEGVVGRLVLKSPQGSTFHIVMENRLHPNAPFGVVTSKVAVESPKTAARPKLAMKWSLTLLDHGDKATSELPNAK